MFWITNKNNLRENIFSISSAYYKAFFHISIFHPVLSDISSVARYKQLRNLCIWMTIGKMK